MSVKEGALLAEGFQQHDKENGDIKIAPKSQTNSSN